MLVVAALLSCGVSVSVAPALAGSNVYLTGVPDYQWHTGCFGTATGNLMGFWDRHGFPNFYTGRAGNGVAPLNSYGVNAEIFSLWASKAGRDGRPAGQPGHEDDYYDFYESTAQDPYVTAGRPEHEPDCLGDFTGLNQKRWANQNGECDGNIDGYSFVYWDASGDRRVNHVPGPQAGLPARDLPSGLRAWTRYRGGDAEVFTQLCDFNPETPAGRGFTYADLKAEIDAGYPLLVFLQNPAEKWRPLAGMPRANPDIHGMLAYGYFETDDGRQFVRVRTSWGSGDEQFQEWTPVTWTPSLGTYLPVRGVIGYRPSPQINRLERQPGLLHLYWDAPAAEWYDAQAEVSRRVHWYVVEAASVLDPAAFVPVGPPIAEREMVVPQTGQGVAFFRVKVVAAP